MTDTSYDLCPTCGREQLADICPAMCGVDAEIENLVVEIVSACRTKIDRAEALACTDVSKGKLSLRNREEHRQEIADLSWTLATLRHIKRQIGA